MAKDEPNGKWIRLPVKKKRVDWDSFEDVAGKAHVHVDWDLLEGIADDVKVHANKRPAWRRRIQWEVLALHRGIEAKHPYQSEVVEELDKYLAARAAKVREWIVVDPFSGFDSPLPLEATARHAQALVQAELGTRLLELADGGEFLVDEVVDAVERAKNQVKKGYRLTGRPRGTWTGNTAIDMFVFQLVLCTVQYGGKLGTSRAAGAAKQGRNLYIGKMLERMSPLLPKSFPRGGTLAMACEKIGTRVNSLLKVIST